MADTAIIKIENQLAAVLGAYAPLAGWTIVAEPTAEVALEPDVIAIYTMAYATSHALEQGQTQHEAEVHFEAVSSGPVAGGIGRRNQEALAHVVAAIALDRSLGGRLEDIQEGDVAPVEGQGRDVAAASLKTTVTFYTPRADWFTIIGSGGAIF